MLKIRLRFEKTGKARYISHLDLMRALRRAFARSELPLSYSEGFNPHPYLSIARPLPVGVCGLYELLDFGLAAPMCWEALPERISRLLPAGLQVIEAYPAARKFQEIAWADYRIVLYWDKTVPVETDGALTALFDGRPLLVRKKSKKNKHENKRDMTEIDAAPLVRDVSLTPIGAVRLQLTAALAAGEAALGPGQLLDALPLAAGEGFIPWTRAEVTRTALLDRIGATFR